MLNNKIILITGGTGSFGKQFVEYVLRYYSPKKLIIYSRDELKQFEMEKTFSTKEKKLLRFFIGDVRDKQRLLMATKNVDILIHSAALKHVEIAEYNPQEFIKTNIHGAENIIEACIENNVSRIIALSTDKASNPINLYGATKLASDKLFIAANNIIGNKRTRFSIVRYGNVIDSRGSLIGILRKISKGKEKVFNLTDKEMSRFFMTLEESVKFVCKSMEYMRGGEIFIPKLPSIKIYDLVKSLDQKIKIKIVGKKPGEKIHESLFSWDECPNIKEYSTFYILDPSILITSKIKSFLPIKEKQISNKNIKNFNYNSKDSLKYSSDVIKKIKNIF